MSINISRAINDDIFSDVLGDNASEFYGICQKKNSELVAYNYKTAKDAPSWFYDMIQDHTMTMLPNGMLLIREKNGYNRVPPGGWLVYDSSENSISGYENDKFIELFNLGSR